ncbi:MAG: 30S ribosomal protein S13 [Helicobacteraceae bacterium]|jgi:small subunit ribosomal protein S13|nr:30S ribosomal protein S13 [Helicobacteraceae bacterium]
MARIAGVDLPKKKRIEFGLTYIYGVGHTTSLAVLKATGISPDKRVADLSEDDVALLTKELRNHTIEGDLRKKIAMDIKNLIDIKTTRGVRHRKGLPVRGQRTKTNARTRKGKRKTVGSKPKEA